MPTGPSSTDARRPDLRPDLRADLWRPVADTGHLLRFRAGAVRRPRAAAVGLGVVLLITVGVGLVPALVPEAGESQRATEMLILLPTMMAGFLVLAVVSAVASGGGRELLSREQAVAFPVSPAADHLGALLMAPLNIAWLFQAWFLLGIAAYGRGLEALGWLQAVVVMWLLAATAMAQVVAWTLEAVRRTPHGVWIVRGLGIGAGLAAVWLQVSGRLGSTLDSIPTLELVLPALGGWSWRWLGTVALLLLLALVAVVVGVLPARAAARMLPRDELKVESNVHPARRMPESDFAMLLRLDRASVWRAVPMRRGLTVLAVGPGLIALAGALPWDTVIILPALVLSGGVLLFGVNAWSLDGRGGLWRESLPAEPAAVFWSRALVMAEWLLAAALVTVVLASLRAGIPTAADATAMLVVLVVVTLQVVAVAMSWSSRRPFAVNMRSARATPAPPVVMVGYSARLATSTTLTATLFATFARLESWEASVLVALPFLLWSGLRIRRASRRWQDPQARAQVVTTVAA